MRDGMTETDTAVYSNFDHVFQLDVMQELAANPNKLFAQHAAWNFCGYVWYDGECWHEEVWVYRELVETRSAPVLPDLIESVNNVYGAG